MKNKDQLQYVSNGGHSPWEPADLQPNHELQKLLYKFH